MSHEIVYHEFEHFKTKFGTFVLGDAKELVKLLPDSSIDAIITDPPWGVGFDEFDDPDIFFEIEKELYRTAKSNSWLVFFYTPKNLLRLSDLKLFRYRWMLTYIFLTIGSISRNPLGGQTIYSIIPIFTKGKPKLAVRRRDVLVSDELPIVECNPKERQFKPTYTVAQLLTMFTKEEDTILDPFAGYGSIPLVCDLFNRKWIAFEIDPIKYAIAKTIIENKKVPDISKIKKELSQIPQRPSLLTYIEQRTQDSAPDENQDSSPSNDGMIKEAGLIGKKNTSNEGRISPSV